MLIRRYTPNDADALAAIYRDAVLGTGRKAYTDEQVAVWARFAEDRGAFNELLGRGYTLIAILDDQPAAFCQLHPDNHVSLLYTAARHGRKGLATAVYAGIEAEARKRGQSRLTTDASKLSRPFFLAQGFIVRRSEQTIRHGVAFERYQMEKVLELSPPSHT